MKNDNDILNTADIPYEVRMKYIIKAYREDQEKWGKLEAYAKHLEAEVARLRDVLIVNGYADTGNAEDAKPAKVFNKSLLLNLQEQRGAYWIKKYEEVTKAFE